MIFFDGWRRIIYYHANTPRSVYLVTLMSHIKSEDAYEKAFGKKI